MTSLDPKHQAASTQSGALQWVNLVQQHCVALTYPHALVSSAESVARQLMDSGEMGGRHPESMAAAMTCFLAEKYGLLASVDVISATAGVSPSTCKACLALVKKVDPGVQIRSLEGRPQTSLKGSSRRFEAAGVFANQASLQTQSA